MGVFGVKGTSAGQASASVVFIKVLLALGRFGSPRWSGHDDLKEKGKGISLTENPDVSRTAPENRLYQTACSKLKTIEFKLEWTDWVFKNQQAWTLSELLITPLVVKTILYIVLWVSTSEWVKIAHPFQDLLMEGAYKCPLLASFKFIRLLIPIVLVPVAPLFGRLGSPCRLSHDDLHCK